MSRRPCCSSAPLAPCAGFTLVEVLAALTITVVLAGAVAAIVVPSHDSFRTQPALADLQQRLRVSVEALTSDLRAAGRGPINGLDGLPLGAVVPPVLPCRIGLRRADAPGAVRDDTLSVVSAAAGAPAAKTHDEFTGPSGRIALDLVPGCAVGSASCGFEEGMSVVLLDTSGQWGLFGVSAVVGNLLDIQARGPTNGRRYSAGSWLVPVEVAVYYLQPAVAPDGPVLARYDASQSDLPLADHVVALSFEYFGDPQPPRPRSPPGPRGERMTYGPRPPLLDEDDPRDDWGPGENCVVAVAEGRQVPRLPALGPDAAPLRPLTAAMLGDGPWCPDASAVGRFDADLLRVRKVRVMLRAEASPAGLRGRDPRLFVRPGTARAGSLLVPDQQVVFDVVPRTLAGGR